MPYSRSRTPSKDNVNIDPYIFLPLYWGARNRGEESFMYEGREVLVAYAFYMVQAAGWADVTPEELSRGDDYPGPAHYTENEQAAHLSGHHAGPTPTPPPTSPRARTQQAVSDRHREIAQYALDHPELAHWEIGLNFNLTRATIQQILARAGQTRVRRGRRINPESKAAQYHAFWLEHPEMTYVQIGQHFGVDAQNILRSIQNYEAALSAEEIRQPRGRGDLPGHYTDETPEGALEAMERRLSGGFSQQMSEALAQMELKVGELAEAVSRMGTSVPAPIVEAAEAVEKAVEAVEVVATGRRPRSESKAQAIRDHIINLGARAGQESVSTVVAALQSSFPDITERDVQNAVRTLPGGSTLGRKPTTRYLSPVIEPSIPPPDTRRAPGFRGSPRTQAIRAYALEQGQGLANISSSDIVAALIGQFPGVTSQHVLEAISLDWRTAFGLPALKAAVRGGPTGSRGTSMLDFIAREPRPERRYGF